MSVHKDPTAAAIPEAIQGRPRKASAPPTWNAKKAKNRRPSSPSSSDSDAASSSSKEGKSSSSEDDEIIIEKAAPSSGVETLRQQLISLALQLSGASTTEEAELISKKMDGVKNVLTLLQQSTSTARGETAPEGAVPSSSKTKTMRLPADRPIYRSYSVDDNPQIFLKRLEANLNANGYPAEKRSLALAASVTGAGEQWAASTFLSPMLWEEACSLFLAHFETEDMEARTLKKLDSVRQRKTETAASFIDRFSFWSSQLSETQQESPLLVKIFEEKINAYLFPSYSAAKAAREVAPSTLEECMKLLFRCDEVRLRPKHCDKCRTEHSPYLGCPRKMTTYAQAVQSKPSTLTSSSSTSISTPASRTEDASTVPTCSRCKRRGHEASACWKDETCGNCGRKGHITRVCRSSSKKVKAFATTAAVTEQSFDDFLHDATQSDSEEDVRVLPQFMMSSTRTPKEKPSEFITVPCTINGARFTLAYDSGAPEGDVLSLETFRERLPHIKIVPTKVKFETIRDSQASSSEEEQAFTTSEPLSMVICDGNTQRETLVKPILYSIPASVKDGILSLQTAATLGIAIVGVPTEFPEGNISNPRDEPSDEGVPESRSKDADQVSVPLNSAARDPALKQIGNLLTENANIKPGQFCTFPESEYDLLSQLTSTESIFVRQYKLPKATEQATDEQVSKWLKTGKIVEAPKDCQHNLPLWPVIQPKIDKNGRPGEMKTRVTVDFKELNKRTRSYIFFTPTSKQVFEKTFGAKVLSSIDLEQGYLQLRLTPQSRIYTTFTWKSTKYMFVGCPFGLANLPAHFQFVLTQILAECREFCMIFIDDIVVFSNSVEEHTVHLQKIISLLTKWNLRLAAAKCDLFCSQLRALGFVINGEELKVCPGRCARILEIPTPTTGRQIAAFLGATNFIREHIPNYAQVTAPLEELRSVKDLRAQWHKDPKYETAFKMVKDILRSPLSLSAPDYESTFQVAVDASQFGVGAVLFQECEVNARKFIALASSSLSKTQRNYPAFKRELLAIVFALRSFRPYLYGVHFKLYTDNRALSFLLNGKSKNYTLNFWAMIILEYDFEMIHRPGIQNVLPDRLSRLFSQFAATTGVIEKFPKKLQAFPMVIDFASPSAASSLAPDQVPEDKVKPSEDEATLMKFVAAEHEIAHAHGKSLVAQIWHKGYYWPTLHRMVKVVGSTCRACLQHNVIKTGFHPLHTVAATMPFDHISFDCFQMPLSKNGRTYGLIVKDRATQLILLRALKDMSALTFAKKLWKIFRDFGLPKIVQSDNGTNFTASVMKEVYQLAGVDKRWQAKYHHRSSGFIESGVRRAKELLIKKCSNNIDEWDDFLPATQLSLNLKISTKSGSTPFSLFFCRQPAKMAKYDGAQSAIEDEKDLIKRMESMQTIIWPAIRSKSEDFDKKIKQYFDKKITRGGQLAAFPVGSYVMMINHHRKSKADARYVGPFKILKENSGGTYTLLSKDGHLHPNKVPPNFLKMISFPGNPLTKRSAMRIIDCDSTEHDPDRKYLVESQGLEDYPEWVSPQQVVPQSEIKRFHKARQEVKQLYPDRTTDGLVFEPVPVDPELRKVYKGYQKWSRRTKHFRPDKDGRFTQISADAPTLDYYRELESQTRDQGREAQPSSHSEPQSCDY